MPDRQAINNELKELNSNLSGQEPRMPYPVPPGYFEGLAEQVLTRIRQEEAKEETKRATRAYARRQETWFSRDARVSWLKGGTKERLDSILSSTISR